MRIINNKNKKSKKRIYESFVLPVLFSILFSQVGFVIFSYVSSAENGKLIGSNLNDISVLTGSTAHLGGGDYFAVSYGNSLFGVVYGNNTNPNCVSVFSITTRIVGVADVYGEKGAKIANDMPIEIDSINALKFLYILEWNDEDSDGVCNFRRYFDGLDGTTIFGFERIYKGIDLHGAWNISSIEEISSKNERIWVFSIYRVNITYKMINNTISEEALERVQFDFKIKASLNEINGMNYPTYKVSVSKQLGSFHVDSIEKTGNANYTGKELAFSSKIDNIIDGWDFDQANEHPRLLLESAWIFGNRASRNVALWAKEQVMNPQTNGTVHIASENAEYNISRENSEYSDTPMKLSPSPISVADSWQKIGYLRWVSEVNVTRNQTEYVEESYMQVQAWKQIYFLNDLAIFEGVALFCGFSYPYGDKIIHDPELGSSVYVLNPMAGEKTQRCGLVGLAITVFAIGTTAIVSSAAGITYIKRKQEQKFFDECIKLEPLNSNKNNRAEFWEKYVGK
ncbi:MAG: hypothetical protein QXT63_03025 [Thermoplasmata archaeon]